MPTEEDFISQYTVICPTAVWNSTFTVIAGISGLGGSVAVLLNGPIDVFFAENSTFYVADYYNNRIQKFNGGSQTATTITNLSLSNPSSVHVTNNGVLYVLDTSNYRVLKWINNVVTVVAGGRGSGTALNQITTSYAMQVDANFNIYVSEYSNNRVTLWTSGNPNISQVVAGGYGAGSSSEKLNGPYGIYVDNSSTLFIADANNHRIQKWLPGAVVGTTVAGQSGTAGSWSYQLNFPTHVMMDQYGYLYIMDANNMRIQKWFPGATFGITVLSSNTMSDPRGIRFDPYGNIVVADLSMDRVISFAMVCPPNASTTVAPTPQSVTPVCRTAVWNQTFSVIGGVLGNTGTTPPLLNTPHNIYIDIYGTLYVADCTNHRIQRFPYGSRQGTTVAGISGSPGSSYSELYYPTSIYVDPSNTMYILDWTYCRVLKWLLGDPLGFVVAGGHGCGGSLTQIDNSYGMFVDNQSNIYISEYRNHRVVKWIPTNTTSGILVAGGYGIGSTPEKLNYPWGVYVDSGQGVYVVDRSNHRVQFWASGVVSGVTVAGMNGNAGPWSYQFSSPTAITFDPDGYMYVLDTGNNRVQQWWPGAAYGKTVMSASLNSAYGLQFDRSGNMIICDTSNHRIVSFSMTCPASTTTTTAPPTASTAQLCPTATWNATVNVQAGLTSIFGSTNTKLYNPANMYFDGYANMYVVDTSNHRIQLFELGSVIGTTVAGNSGSSGTGYSELSSPSAIYVDANRIMYILDTSNYRVLKWTLGEPMGYIVAGSQSAGSALTQISTSNGMFVDNQYNIYVSDNGNNRVTLWLATNRTAGIVVAGGNGVGNTPAKLNNPWGIYVDANQAVFIADRGNHRVQRWDNGVLSGVTVAGTTGSSGSWSYQFNNPTALIVDPLGYIYVLDSTNARIQKWWPGAFYGSTVFAASFSSPLGMQLDRLNNLVIADTNNHRIVSFGLLCPPTTTTTALPPTSTTSQICATAVWSQGSSSLAGLSGNVGSSTSLLNSPSDVAFDRYLNLYVADTANHRIQQFSSGSLIGTTVAGVSGSSGSGYSQLNSPSAIYVDANRTMYILDMSNYRVLKWTFGDPLGYIVAGNQASGTALTQITTSYAMFVDNQNNVYVSEFGNHRVTLWLTTNTTAGILVAGGNGLGSTPQKLNNPWGVYVDVSGTIFVVDKSNHRVQRWYSGALSGTTVAGSSTDQGPYAYQFNNPTGITFDPFGYMYVLDSGNSRVQRWLPGGTYGTTVIATPMSSPSAIKVGPSGNMVIADTSNYYILSFTMTCPPTSTTTTVPPTQGTTPVCATAVWDQAFNTLAGAQLYSGSTVTLFSSPSDIGFDGYQNMYVVDTGNHRIQRIPSGSNVGTTVAGVAAGSSGSRLAELSSPYAIQVTTNQTMFILDTNNYRVLKWTVGDTFGLVVAGGQGSCSTFNCIATSYALFVDNQYNTYVSESGNHRVTMWLTTNTSGGQLVAGGNGVGNTADKLNSPWGIYVDVNGRVFVVDRSNHRVQRWDVGAAVGVTVAGSTSDSGPWSYQFSSPTSITFDQFGYMYVLDYNNDRVQKWFPEASFGITVVAASLANPRAMRFDRLSNIVVADTGAHRILSFGLTCPPATTTTVVPPTQPFVPLCTTATWNQTFYNLAGALSTSGSTATLLAYPYDVAFDGYDYVYVVDTNNHRIQRFAPGSNIGVTVAGFSLGSGTSRAELYYPSAIAVTPNGTMFILDNYNFRVLKWQVGDQVGYVVAGGHGNGSLFTQMGYSRGIFADDQYNIYLSEQTNHRVTLWSVSNTTAGQLVAGGNGVGNTADKLNSPWGIYVNVNRAIFVVDRSNHRVQRWDLSAANGITVAGSTSDSGPWSYQFNNPTAITFDQYSYMYILDYSNNRVQKWLPGAIYGTTVIIASFSNPTGLKIHRLDNDDMYSSYKFNILSSELLAASTTTTTAPFPTTIPLCATATWNQSISLVAGATSSVGFTATLLNNPYYVAFDGYHNMYVVDFNNHRVQQYQEGSFIGTTVAGFSLSSGSSRSEFFYPVAIRVTRNQTMFVLDRDNYRVLKWQVGDPIGYVIAGGHGGGSLFTQMGTSYDIFLDSNYNLYVSENFNNRITLWSNGNTTAGRLVAGGNGAGNSADKFNGPWGIHVDASNTLYVVDRSNHRVQRWLSGASLGDTVAGSTSDSGPWSYQLNSPTIITMDSYGYIYIMDSGNGRVQKWWPGAPYGITVAASTTLVSAYGLALDPYGNIIVADTTNHRVVRFNLLCLASTTTTIAPPTQPFVSLCSTPSWNASFSTVAGAASAPGSIATLLNSPYDLAFDGYDNMYVVDTNNNRVQKYLAGSFIGATVAGFTLTTGSTRAQLYAPTAISVTPNGTMFIVDDYNFRVLRWQDGDQLGYVVAGGRGLGSTYDKLGHCGGIFVDEHYNVYVSDNSNHRVTLWYSGNTTAGGLVAGGNGVGSSADKLNSPWGIYVNANGSIYIVDRGNHRVQLWIVGGNAGITVAGSTGSAGSWSYQLSNPTTVALDQYGDIYVLDQGNSRVQKWSPGATYGTTVISASMSSPYGMRIGRLGNILITDTNNHRVISFPLICPPTTTTTTAPPTQISASLCPTAAWNSSFITRAGVLSYSGSRATLLYYPYDMTFDGYQNMYVVDCYNHRIQRYPAESNTAQTVAGVSLASGSGLSELSYPSAIYVDSNGAMYILDTYNFRVLKWQIGDPLGAVIVGGRGSGSTLDKIGYSYGMFVDNQYNVYVSDNANHRVIKWLNGNTTAGILIAGGNGASNTPATLNGPWGVYVDSANTLYVVDRNNHRVQRWLLGAAVGVTVAGSTSESGPWSYQFNNPTAIIFDQYGYMYVLDQNNNRIQKWLPGAAYGTTVLSVSMNIPMGMQWDLLGNLVVADSSNHRVLSFPVICPGTTTTAAPQSILSTVPLCATAVWNQTYLLRVGSTATFGTTGTLLNSPYDVTFDGYDNMYVVDTSNHRIQIYPQDSSSPMTLGITGSAGSARAQFNTPYAIRVTRNATMYILDGSNYRVLRWQRGEPLGFVVAGGQGSGSAFTQIGTSYALFLDSQYNIYVSEYGNNRVTMWTAGNTTASVLVAGGNGVGSTADRLNGPWGIYVDSSHAVYVVDRNNQRVQKWSYGSVIGVTVAGMTGTSGPWSYQFNNPTAIMFDIYGFMYVLDTGNNRVQKWWPGEIYGITVISVTMSNPCGMRFNRLGYIFIADTSYHRVLSFAPTCPTTTTTPPPSTTQMAVTLCPTATWNSTFTQLVGGTSLTGSTPYLLSSPYDVTVDAYQNIYVVDYNNHRIQRFPFGSIRGETVAGVSASLGTGFSQLYYPTAIYVDSNATMYILDSNNYRVLQWNVDELLGTVIVGGRGSGSTLDKIALSYGMFVDNQYNVYVSENANNRVAKWFNGNTTAGVLVAGGNGVGSTADKLNGPWGIFVDGSNTVFIVDRNNHRVQKWVSGVTAGVTIAGSNGDPGPWSYQFNNPTAIMFDIYGFMYVLDSSNSRVQKWWPGGSFGTTVLSATLSGPIGMTIDRAGSLYVADTGYHRILTFSLWCPTASTVTAAPPTLTTTLMCPTAIWNSNVSIIIGATSLAGSTPTFLSSPYGVNFDGYQNVYVADTANHRIQQYSPNSNVGRTVAGVTSSSGTSLAQLNNPSAISFDAHGIMYILDTFNYRVLKWTLGDTFGTVVVNGRGLGTTLDKIGVSYAMFLDSQNNIYVSEYGNHRVTKWWAGNNTVGQLVAGTSVLGNSSDKLNYPVGVYVDANSVVYVSDRSNHRIQKWSLGAAIGITIAGQSSIAGPWSYQLNLPTAITFDQYGYMYILDGGNSRIQRWLPGMTYGVTVVAGALGATPYGMNFDFSGNIIVADTSYHRLISFIVECPNATTVTAPMPTLPQNIACQTGVFNTTWIVAAGNPPSSGSAATYLNNPIDIYVDGNQYIYVADYANNRIQKFPPAGTTIGPPTGHTVAGFTQTGGNGYSELTNPTSIFVDPNGVMYIADSSNYRIQKWLPNQPLGFTVAGGRGNGATLDKIGLVYAFFVDNSGNIYISEYSNHRVTLWRAFNTTIGQLVAGLGSAGAALNQLNSPWGIFVDSNAAIYISDRANHRVVTWSATSGTILAGTTGSAGSSASLLSSPTAITVDSNNYLYVMDAGNNRIQRFTPGSSVGDTLASMAFINPRGMRLDSISNLYIADMSNHQIILFICVYNASTTTISTTTTTSETTTSATTTSTTSETTTTGITTSTTSTTSVTTPSTISSITSTTISTAAAVTTTGAGGTTTTAAGGTTTTGAGGTTTTGAGGTTASGGGGTTASGAGGTTTAAGSGGIATGAGSSQSSTNVGAMVGAAFGGAAAVAIIGGIAFLAKKLFSKTTSAAVEMATTSKESFPLLQQSSTSSTGPNLSSNAGPNADGRNRPPGQIKVKEQFYNIHVIK
ncbi:unnamed protein product [Rotaria sordida]|uniref:NHL repeat containing protein n=1 Tax=Rotaria sordida TaxID=392033 RepID=A0A814Q9E6_9BILA|nr:unnamed protein product [Rotaria sordida]